MISGLMEPSTSTSLDHTPDNVIYSILRELERADLLNCKLISRRFQRFISRNAAFLARPSVNELFIQMRDAEIKSKKNGKVEKSYKSHCIQLRKSLHKSRRSLDIKAKTFIDGLERTLKSYTISNSITLDGIQIDDDIIDQFLKPTTDLKHVDSVSFVLTCFKNADWMLGKVLEKTSCRSLIFEFCSNVQDVLTDTLLRVAPNLETLYLRLAEPTRLTSLTNSTLDHWSDNEKVPKMIKLDNSFPKFTIDSIFRLIQKLISQSQQSPTTVSIDWSFGCIEVSPSDLLPYLQQATTNPTGYKTRLRPLQQNYYRIFVDIDAKTSTTTPSTPLAELERLAKFGSSTKLEDTCSITFDVVIKPSTYL
ncbi:unnamed protein product [Bursaphelenchus okinawaensis]|uniref:F-box domain-containing protein n=1 Tax=Bursaphelenchus okinawaensis TaxID=465554 RepID=A0A811L7B5_9BILA|nr:unnamed protein product [Bursaphelenchus okinawaensis]CAG9119369.1 unnamed protein product [Bursaphelenchus okinawaensis]